MNRNEYQSILRLRHELATLAFQIKLEQHHAQMMRKYSDNQPRAPAGQPDGGQWTSGESGGNTDPSGLQLAAGFDKEDLSKTVQEFMSEKCEGDIRRRMPGQFLDMTIDDMMKLKRSGDRPADTCYKLLNEKRFRK